MVTRQSLIVRIVFGALTVAAATARAMAVWPPATSFQEEQLIAPCGFVVVAFVIGLILGIWAQKRNEHK